MKKYKITEERQVTQYWVFEVEANTESEALEAVLRGDIQPADHFTSTPMGEDEDSHYSVDEVSDDSEQELPF
jgi:hypothetical protein